MNVFSSASPATDSSLPAPSDLLRRRRATKALSTPYGMFFLRRFYTNPQPCCWPKRHIRQSTTSESGHDLESGSSLQIRSVCSSLIRDCDVLGSLEASGSYDFDHNQELV